MDLAVNFKGGGSIVDLKPSFSTDGQDVFVASKNSIFQYNTKTGKVLFEYKGLNENIVGFSFNQINDLECLTACSKSGNLIVWKTTKKLKLLEVQLKYSNVIHFSLLSTNLAKGLNCLVAYNTKNDEVAFAIVNTKKPAKPNIVLKIAKRKFAVDICKDKYFAVVSQNYIYFVNIETCKISRSKMAKKNRKFTCLTCHSNEEMVLTGDYTGRMVLWQDIFGKKSQAVYHWHTLPVNCLAFSALGSYFYSGANESVLVKWQMDNPNQKQFLPRLPGGIVQISVSDNNAFVAVATSDNAVRIVDSQMNQVTLIQRLVLGNQFESGILYDPMSRALVMNGNIGCVQFYSPSDMSLLYNVDIVNQNKITDERDCKLENTDVRKLAVSLSGKWLATVEERREKDVSKEIRLKFWFFNSEKQTYELNTSIEFPHDSSINSIALQPTAFEDNLKCITVGNDKMFKIWQIYEIATVHRTGPIWNCANTGTFRDMSCQGLSFCIDGSLFAIAFGSILTVWSSESCELKCSLVHSNFKKKINSLQFGQGSQCHLIASVSKRQLCVWNILTLTMSWVVNLSNISLLVADPLSTYMMVICDSGKKVFVFEPSASNIVFSKKDLMGSKKIVAATFVPSMYSNDTRLQWYERSNLYLLTASRELYCVSKSEEPYNYVEGGEDMAEEMSVFKKIKPQTQTSEVKHQVKHHMFPKDKGYKSYRQYLESPIETLPPARILAASLLESLALQREGILESREE